jgi:Asp-tRNA(Asn)/Glu-tRNA(Gln) amidotransferase A subunit family amidase
MLAELAAAVQGRRVSARELVTLALERIDRLNPALNAVILVRGDEALAEATALDERIAAAEKVGPFAGLPLLVKDNEDAAGLPTTFASLLRADASPAEEDCDVVGRLRDAGAVVVGKTNLPEFAFEGFTSNRLFGTTRNPWAPDWSPGGSSGGSGAALMSGMAPLVTGTDGGGSIRIPAAFCGFVGLKPTNGLIGQRPAPSWIDLSTKGPMTTSVADARLLLDVLRGPIAGDPKALPSWTPDPSARATRILATPRLVAHDEPIAPGVLALFERAVAGLEAATQLPVERIEPPYPAELDDDWLTIAAVDELTWIGREVVAARRDELTDYLREVLEIAERIGVDEYQAARRRRFDFCRQTDELLGTDAVLVCPTMCVEGFPADGRFPDAEQAATEGQHYNNQPANLTGHSAISVPAGVSGNGVPFGLQITGPRFRDDVVLGLAEMWETANPWPAVAPGYESFAVA